MKNLPKKLTKNSLGFTLVELIVVVGMLAILLAVVLVALNPAQRFQDTNEARRRSDVQAILNAIHTSIADTRGTVPAGIDNNIKTIMRDATPNTPVATELDLCAGLVGTGYLGSIPVDPVTGTEAPAAVGWDDCTDVNLLYNAQYTVTRNATSGTITVASIADPAITASR